MRGRGCFNVREVRLLLSSSRVRFGGGFDSSVLSTKAEKHLLCLNRDDDFLQPVTTFWKNVYTPGVPDESHSLYRATSAYVNTTAHGRPLADVTSAPTSINPATSHKFDSHSDTATGLAQARKIWWSHQSLIPNIYHACSIPRMCGSFATLRERVKDEEDEEESRGHERPASQNSSVQRPDADTSIPEAVTKDRETNLEFGKIERRDVHEKELDRFAEEPRGNLAWSEAGWTREEVWNWPNSISMARLLAGPVLAWMISQEFWSMALVGLIVAGFSDWLDGYVARRMEINSVLGSYLDPVADKVLVGSVAISMSYAGLLHPALVGLVVARDGVLVGGAFVYRAYSLRWQWRNWREFFRINVGGAGKVEPLFISKVNTVLQLGLIGVALGQPALSIEDTYSLVPLLSWSVAGSTAISWGCYAYQYLKNLDSLAALRHMPQNHSGKKS